MTEYMMPRGSRFSREWRRSKRYTEPEIRRLCRRRGCEMSVRRQIISVSKGGKVIAEFHPIEKPVLRGDADDLEESAQHSVLRNYAALRLRP